MSWALHKTGCLEQCLSILDTSSALSLLQLSLIAHFQVLISRLRESLFQTFHTLSTWCLITSREAKYRCLVEIKRFFLSWEIYFCHFLLWDRLSRWPANSIAAKNSSLFREVRGDRRYLWCVINSEGLFGQYPNKYSKKKLPGSQHTDCHPFPPALWSS